MPTEVKGVIELRKALAQFAPDLAKELKRELNDILKPIVREAQSFVPAISPMSGWAPRAMSEASFPFYDSGEIRRGIVFKTTPSLENAQGFKNVIRIQNLSAAGAIYETAGRKNGQGQDWVGPGGGSSKGKSRSVNPYAGNQFISNLGNLYGSGKKSGIQSMMGRLIFRAWAATQGKANASVLKAIKNAEEKFSKRAGAAAGLGRIAA